MERYHAYGKYRKARNAAWQCLLDCQVRSLPVNLKKVAEVLHVALGGYSANAAMLRRKGYAPLLEAAGFSYADAESHMIIFYNDKIAWQQTRVTIAHELGHILLGHMKLSVPRNQLLLPSEPKLEKEADRFALRLLAPACALWALDACSPSSIAALCDIPLDWAQHRARRMRELRKRNEWLSSPQERRLFEQMGLSRPDGGRSEDQ